MSTSDNAPIGVSAVTGSLTNAPFTFWSTFITTRAQRTESYRQQLALPWGNSESNKIGYRVCDNGTWRDWKYFPDENWINNKINTGRTQNVVALQTNTTEHLETSGALQWSSAELVYMHTNFIGWNGSLYGAGQLHVKKAGAYLIYIRATLVTYTITNANLLLGLHMSTDSGANFGAAMYNLYLSNYNPTYTATVMIDTGYNNPYSVNGQMPSPVRLRLEVEQIANVSKYHVFMKFYYVGDVYG